MGDRTTTPPALPVGGAGIDVEDGPGVQGQVPDRRFREMLETLPHMVWTCESDGRCDYLSRQWVEYTGVPEAEQLGFGWLAQLHPDDARRTGPAWQDAIRRGIVFDVDYRIRRFDGVYRWFKTRAVPMRDATGHVVQWMGSNTDVEEHKQLEAQQRAERERLDFLMSATPTVVYVANPHTGDATFASENAVAMLGHPIERLVSEPGFWFAHTHPEDRGAVEAALAGIHEDQQIQRLTFEYRFRHKDGDWRWLLDEVLVCRDDAGAAIELIGSLLDITARKRVEERLQQSEARLDLAVRGTSDGLWELNIRTGEVFQSPRYHELLGYEPGGLPATLQGFFERVHPDDRSVLDGALKAHFDRREPYDIELRMRTRSGEYRWFRDRGQAERNAAGEPVRAAGAITDISEKKQATAAMLAAKQAAEAANRAKSEFVANMSHEIRTPLNGVTGAAQLLHLTTLTAEQREYVDAITASSDGLLALINDVLELSKIEARQVELDRRAFRLRACIDGVVSSQASLAAGKSLPIDLQLDDDVPDTLVGDPRRLRQILLNLLGNAIKFTDAGRICISARVVERHDDIVVVDLGVTDTGIGIAAAALPRIFAPFVQADASTARRYGGTGLGLAISLRLADLLGGTILAESEPDRGSTFTLRVPLLAGDVALDQAAQRPRDLVDVRWSGPPLKLLVVDDVPLNRLIATRLLQRYGHIVVEAADGGAALAQTEQQSFDAVLMDIQMPGMTGVEATQAIRARERTSGAHLPIIALTAHALQEERDEILHEGFDGYIAKPMEIGMLLQELRRCVAASSPHEA